VHLRENEIRSVTSQGLVFLVINQLFQVINSLGRWNRDTRINGVAFDTIPEFDFVHLVGTVRRS